MLLKNRILSALLSVALTAALTGAIMYAFPEKPGFSSQIIEISPAQLEEGITHAVTGVPSDETILTVDGNDAPAELLTYQIGYSCAYLDYMLSSYTGAGLDLSKPLPSGEDPQDYIRTQSLDMVKQLLVLENLAAKYGVTLSSEDEAALEAQRKADIEEFGEAGYRAELYKMGLSETGYDRTVRSSALYQALYEAYNTPGSPLYAEEADLLSYAAAADYITADHILLSTVDSETREPLDEAVVAEKKSLAEDILQQLRRSDDPLTAFAALADEYGEDPGRQTNPQGYTFTRGTMVEAFDSAARALGENEISDIVESEYGFHIILRRPLDSAAAASVRDEYFEVFFTSEADKSEMTLSPAVERFDVAALYEALRAAQGGAETPALP